MKKILSVLLVLVLLLSLCACGKKKAAATDPSDVSSATGNAEATGTTGATNATGETKGTDSTEGTSAPTSAPTKATDPKPAACSHSWADATCTAVKKCSKCGATEGSALGHSWNAATCKAPKTCSRCGATEGSTAAHNYSGDVCSVCNANAPIKDFLGGWWTAYIVRPAEYCEKIPDAGDILSTYSLKTEAGEEMYAHKDYYSNIHYGHPNNGTLPNNGTITYNGKTYYDFWFSSNMGGFDEIKAEANGNVRVDFMNDNNIVLKRESATKFVVVSSEYPENIPVGTIFEKKN